MGVLFSSPGEMMEKNSEKMLQFQKEIMLKQRQLMLAHQFALGKDRFMFFQSFFFTAIFGLVGTFIKTKNPLVLGPLVPMGFSYAYQWDMFNGNKMKRIKLDAEKMIKENPELFSPAENNLIITDEEYKKIMNIK